jgi:hypothetical protein
MKKLAKIFLTLIVLNKVLAYLADDNVDSSEKIEETIGANKTANGVIIFKDKLNKCPMYTYPGCEFDILLKNSIDINKVSLKSSEIKVFKNATIELCNETDELLNKTNFKQKCSNYSSFKELNQDLKDEYTVYKMKYVPVLVGVAELMINIESESDQETPSLFNYTIVVVQPKRVIDLIFDIWVWSFGILISCLMGILLDRTALKEIVKKPIPVVIGFVCQYCFMPLVSQNLDTEF